MTFEAALDLAVALAFSSTAMCVGLAFGVEVHAPHDDGVQCRIQLTIATPIESMTDDLAG